nr:PEP-CTERM sorting domain-containing protein [uncultured Rhodopila sp.]
MRLTSLAGGALLSVALTATALTAQATNLVTNGSFEDIGTSSSQGFTIVTGSLPGWDVTSSGTFNNYNALVSGTATDSFGGPSAQGPAGYSPSYFWTDPGSSPDGGNFVAADGDSAFAKPISQTITGLTVGDVYSLVFYQAAAQQAGFNGATTEAWQVTFGGVTQTSATMNNADQGAVAWEQQTLSFTAVSATQVLSFLAVGTPNGLPPVSLLDGISLTPPTPPGPDPVPEPLSISLLGVSVIGIAAVRRRRRSAD